MLPPLALLVLAQAAAPSPAPPPASDVYLLDLQTAGARVHVNSPTRITDWKGYDNQPSFTRNGRGVLHTSIREDGQADIYRYDLGTRALVRVTSTPEAEYSPTLLPEGGGISVIRVEKDGAQRLWRFPTGGGEPSLLLRDVKPVGYHAWTSGDTLVLFVLGSPATLQVASVKTGEAEVVARNVGRSLHRIPGTTSASYVDKAGVWTIRRLDPLTKKTEAIVATLDGSEDYAWTPDGRLLMAQGSRLFSYRPGKDTTWRVAADLEEKGIRRITRLAVSPGGERLALVADPPKE